MFSQGPRIGLGVLVLALTLPCIVGATVHDITIGNNFFSPLGTTVSPGDTVRWTWVGGVPHNTTSDASSAKSWSSATSSTAGFTFEIVITAGDGPGPFPYRCTIHSVSMLDTIFVSPPTTCCGEFTEGFTGNANCDTEGKRNLGDITRLVDRVYVSKADLCCEEEGNVNGDLEGKINLGDITKLIDHVYVSKEETSPCS